MRAGQRHLLPVKPDRPHINSNMVGRRGRTPALQQAGCGIDTDFIAAKITHNIIGNTASAIATSHRITAITVKNLHKNVGFFGGSDNQDLVTANT